VRGNCSLPILEGTFDKGNKVVRRAKDLKETLLKVFVMGIIVKYWV
jgi:hypothetical protein